MENYDKEALEILYARLVYIHNRVTKHFKKTNWLNWKDYIDMVEKSKIKVEKEHEKKRIQEKKNKANEKNSTKKSESKQDTKEEGTREKSIT